MTVAVFILSLLGAMALGMPIAFALLVCAVALMVHLGNFDAQILAQNVLEGTNNYPLMAVPFFMLAGELMNAGGLSKRIIAMAQALVGHVTGGLGYVAIIAALVMASISGSAIADTAALAAVLVPLMRQAGYNIPRASGLIAAGGIIAPIIPPSIPFVVFGVIAQVSVTKLFLAGIVPGLLMGLVLAVDLVVLRQDRRAGAGRARPLQRDAAPPRAARRRLGAGAAGGDHRRHEGGRVHAHRGGGRRGRLLAAGRACSSTANSTSGSCRIALSHHRKLPPARTVPARCERSTPSPAGGAVREAGSRSRPPGHQFHSVPSSSRATGR